MTARIVVYSRDGCHLCDELVAELDALLAPRGVTWQLQDVDADPATRRRFGLKVPVVTLDGGLVCHGRLDSAELLERLAR